MNTVVKDTCDQIININRKDDKTILVVIDKYKSFMQNRHLPSFITQYL